MRLIIITVLIAGCGKCSQDPVPVDPSTSQTSVDQIPTSEEATIPEDVAPPEPRAKPAPPTPEQLAAAREAKALFRQGRRLAHRAIWDQAVTKFRESIEKSDSASARCELGWALFQTAQLDEAKRELERGAAILGRRRHRERERNTLAACLYNLGRVVEASDPDAAAQHYRDSLEVRPNQTVAARLEQLGSPEPVTATCEPQPCDGPFANEDAAFQSIGVGPDGHKQDRFRYSEGVVVHDEATGSLFDSGSKLHGIVHYDTSWYVCDLGDGGNGSMTDGVVSSAQWVAGRDPEITFDFEVSDTGHEEGIANTMGTVNRFFIGRRDDEVVLYGRLLVSDYYEDGMWTNCHCDDEVDAEEGELDMGFECCELEDISSSTWTRVAYADSGRLRLTRGQQDQDGHVRQLGVEVVALEELGCAQEQSGDN